MTNPSCLTFSRNYSLRRIKYSVKWIEKVRSVSFSFLLSSSSSSSSFLLWYNYRYWRGFRRDLAESCRYVGTQPPERRWTQHVMAASRAPYSNDRSATQRTYAQHFTIITIASLHHRCSSCLMAIYNAATTGRFNHVLKRNERINE